MTIAAIIEMGGLLTKEARYFDFTTEKSSDLLAEMDVWNAINKMGYINFQELGINKKNFFKIKEHIKKLREALYGIVEITNNDDREAVVKSCLSGLISHIYIRDYDRFYDINGNDVRLDRKSCLPFGDTFKLLIGIPKTIEFKNRYGSTQSIDLVGFATKIDIDNLLEIAPNSIEMVTKLRYSKSKDAVEVIIQKRFAGMVVDTEITYNRSHPAYNELKSKYEAEMKNYINFSTNKSDHSEGQRFVTIDGKPFKVYAGFSHDDKPTIYLDDETLFTTEVNDVFLDSGERVYVSSNSIFRSESNITALRNAVENNRLQGIRARKKQEYEKVKVKSLSDILGHKNMIGQIKLTMDNGGYGKKRFMHMVVFLSKKIP